MNPTESGAYTVTPKLSLAQDEIAVTAAGISEEQLAVVAGHLGGTGRVFVAGAVWCRGWPR